MSRIYSLLLLLTDVTNALLQTGDAAAERGAAVPLSATGWQKGAS